MLVCLLGSYRTFSYSPNNHCCLIWEMICGEITLTGSAERETYTTITKTHCQRELFGIKCDRAQSADTCAITIHHKPQLHRNISGYWVTDNKAGGLSVMWEESARERNKRSIITYKPGKHNIACTGSSSLGISSFSHKTLLRSVSDVDWGGLAPNQCSNIIPKVFSGAEAGALCLQLESFHFYIGLLCFHGPHVVHGVVVIVEYISFLAC